MKRMTPQHHEEEPEHPVTLHSLSELHFDMSNPRYGPSARRFKDGSEVLDHIAEAVGLEDLLSSMAVNRFFPSEPLIGIRSKGSEIEIHEGNRRLAAALILSSDPRGKNQNERRKRFGEILKAHGNQLVESVPVMVFEGKNAVRELLPHLGVKHIVGAQPWNAYAKAAWVAKAVHEGKMSLDDVIQMIGDEERTSERILSAYYLVAQLEKAERFDPSDSVRRGRGSQAEFPFSLVYNAIDRPQIRRWINMPEGSRAVEPNPVKGNLDNAESLMLFLCGSRRREIDPVVKDSRQITSLARALDDPVLANALKTGRSLADVEQEALPAYERLLGNLSAARVSLEDALGVAGRGTLGAKEATKLLDTGRNVRALAQNVVDLLAKAAASDE